MEFVAPLAVFLALYFFLWRRAGQPPVQWGWLALIIGLAAAAVLVGALTR